MKAYQTKTTKITGTSYKEVYKKAIAEFSKIKARTKRWPYVRSAYFNRDKVFFTYFWQHLNQKPARLRSERIRYFSCGVELLRNSRNNPTSKQNPRKENEVLHRFFGLSPCGDSFVVQVKEHKRTGRKELMSIFPIKNPPQ